VRDWLTPLLQLNWKDPFDELEEAIDDFLEILSEGFNPRLTAAEEIFRRPSRRWLRSRP
jgi:hypothetical protein